MNTVNCPKCIQGTQTYEEDCRMVKDMCYHCSGSGRVDVRTAHHDRMMDVSRTLAYKHVQAMKKACNEDEEGEGWDFCAAENMMSEHDYTEMKVYDFAYDFAEKLTKLPLALQEVIAEAIEVSVGNAQKVCNLMIDKEVKVKELQAYRKAAMREHTLEDEYDGMIWSLYHPDDGDIPF